MPRKKTCTPLENEEILCENYFRKLEQKIEKTNRFRFVYLQQSDFEQGTLRITQPGVYILQQDIIFDPPVKIDSEKYPDKAYTLGFFAAITIETDHVILDLNNHSIVQSEAHALRQRFYAHIELANTPFIPKQGPADFGNTFHSTKKCIVKNGTLGRSSHHGIHGNGASEIWLKNLHYKDFEFAGQAINGGRNHLYENLTIGPNLQDLPVLATFSQAHFLVDHAQKVIDANPSNREALVEKTNILRAEIESSTQQLLTTGETNNPLFRNEERLPDGNAYGLLVHVLGAAVGDLIPNTYLGEFVNNVKVKNVSINNIKIKVDEILGISRADGSMVQTDNVGGAFQVERVSDAQGRYVGTSLSNLQIELAKADAGPLGRLSISPEVVAWAESGTLTLQEAVLNQKQHTYKCGGDCMFHVNKGVFGLRLDGVHNLLVENCEIANISNEALLGNDEACGNYERSHDGQNQLGYRGADSTGISLANCRYFDIKSNNIKHIHSHNGEVRGIHILNGSRFGNIRKNTHSNLHTGYVNTEGRWYGRNHKGEQVAYDAHLPNLVPHAIGVKIDDQAFKVKVKENNAQQLQAPGIQAAIVDDSS